MVRRFLLATMLLLVAQPGRPQDLRTLTIKVVLDDAGQQTPVPGHRLLVSDSPPTSAPRLTTTGPDGTATIRVRPGRYTVESDRAVALNGKAYEWFQDVNILAGKDATLILTAANAETSAAAVDPARADAAASQDADPMFLLPRWQDSVVVIWTELARGSGFVVDGKGLIATSQRLIGTATSVEVQFTASIKVTANVVKSDRPRDVAVLRIEPSSIASIRSISLGCGQAETPPIVEGQELFALGIPRRQAADMREGTVSRLDPRRLGSTITMDLGAAGGPVFTADGRVAGMAVTAENDETRNARVQVVRTAGICEAVAEAETKLGQAESPSAARLPVESTMLPPIDGLKDAVSRRAGSLSPYQTSSSTFDIAFITPLMIYGLQYQADRVERRGGAGSGTRPPARREPAVVPPLLYFHNWSEYVSDLPSVLLVRVTPKQVEGFWTTVARGAAYTQGVALPSMKHAATGFARMKAFCGSTKVVPIHPFKIEQRISETEAIAEGLHVFAPDAFGPHCADVRFEIYSEKAPLKPEPRAVDASIVQQVWQDFAPYRAAAPPAAGGR